MPIVKMSSKNQIVLPKEAREAMNLKAYAELLVVVKGAVTIILPKPENYRDELAGTGRGIYKTAYLKKERSSW